MHLGNCSSNGDSKIKYSTMTPTQAQKTPAEGLLKEIHRLATDEVHALWLRIVS
jgi:hypothetical protein